VHRSKLEILTELDLYLKNMTNDGLKTTSDRVMKLTQQELVLILPQIVTQLAVLSINKQD